MDLAIAELERARDVAETNAPINEREGNREQALLERQVSAACTAAIAKLKAA